MYTSGRCRIALALLALCLLTISGDVRAAYRAPRRSLRQIAHAIGISRPGLSQPRRQVLARVLIDVATAHNFDPLSGWAIIDHESHWRPTAVSPDGKDIGLAQIRYSVRRPCVKDLTSVACQQLRERLFDPRANIRMMAVAITAWRKLCTEKMGKAPDMRHWLAGYGGYSHPKAGIYCGHQRVRKGNKVRWRRLPTPKAIQDILDARHRMIRRLRKDRVD